MVDTKQIFTDSLDAFEMKLSVDIDNEVTGSNDQEKGSVRVVSGSGFRYVVPFPWRLHEMLQDIERSGEDSIVSWLPDGNHFQ